jgi:transposase
LWLPGSADEIGEPGDAMARYEVSDELWARIQSLLPVRPDVQAGPDGPGRVPLDDRASRNGILFVLLTGIPGRPAPAARRRLRDDVLASAAGLDHGGVWDQLHAPTTHSDDVL